MGYACPQVTRIDGETGSGAARGGCAEVMVASRFLLKTAPPKLGRALPARPRLEHRWAEINDRTAIVVTAPQGFGKTTLLAQWRRRWLERGAFVAWATLNTCPLDGLRIAA